MAFVAVSLRSSLKVDVVIVIHKDIYYNSKLVYTIVMTTKNNKTLYTCIIHFVSIYMFM